MRHITDNSAVACLENRKLFVRQRGSGAQIRFDLLEEGAKGSGGRCGNFIAVDAHISKEFIRPLTNGGDHVSLARVWVGESGPHPLRIYTYSGTRLDSAVARLAADPDSSASLVVPVLGLLTYDYFTIAQTVQEDDGTGRFVWRDAKALKDFIEVPHPLSLVVFGRAQP